MDEAMKRRLVGVLVIVVLVFLISLLLPHPGTVKTDGNNQRVTLDLGGKEPEELHTTPTPVPPVIAAAPAPTEPKPASAENNGPPPQIEEPPVSNNLPAESMTDDEPPQPPKPQKPAEVASPKPATPTAKPKPETAVAAAAEKPAPAKVENKPAQKVEDSLKQKPVAAAPAKPAEKTPPKPAAKPPVEVAKAAPPAAKPAAAPGKSRWFVQVGAFTEVANAHQVLDKLNAKGLKGLISPLDSEKGTRYRARIGPFATRDLAKQAQDKAAKLGYAGSSVVED